MPDTLLQWSLAVKEIELSLPDPQPRRQLQRHAERLQLAMTTFGHAAFPTDAT
jgi:hypothetical protein